MKVYIVISTENQEGYGPDYKTIKGVYCTKDAALSALRQQKAEGEKLMYEESYPAHLDAYMEIHQLQGEP